MSITKSGLYPTACAEDDEIFTYFYPKAAREKAQKASATLHLTALSQTDMLKSQSELIAWS